MIYARMIAKVILADAEVTDAEHDFLEKVMERLGLSEDDKSSVVENVDTSDDIAEDIWSLDDKARKQLLTELRGAAIADDAFGDSERALIDQVEKLLGG